jgi:ribosomal-protein-alanine N-acetyltransferase
MEAPSLIESSRLVVRPAVPADAEAAFAYASDPEVTTYLTITPRETVEQVEEYLIWGEGARERGESFLMAITLKETGRFIGMITLRVSEHGVELGYALQKAAWGSGYMTEVVRAVKDWVLDQADVYRVWAYVDVANVASRRVLEKAGMANEGTLHRWQVHPNLSPEPADMFTYAAWR